MRRGARGRLCAPLLPLTLLSVATTACGPPTERNASVATTASVDRLVGGGLRIVSPARGLGPARRWRLVEDLRLGSPDGSGPAAFTRVPALALDGADRLWVVDQGAAEVRVFDAHGTFVRAVGGGRRDEASLTRPAGVWVVGERVWVTDPARRDWLVWDTAGTFVRAYRFPGFATGGDPQVDPDGLWDVDRRRGEEGGTVRILGRYQARGDRLVLVDSFPAPPAPAPPVITLTPPGAGPRSALVVPFAPRPERHTVPGGGWWANPGDGSYRILLLGPRGDTVRWIEREFEPVPVGDEARSTALVSVPPELRAAVREQIPTHLPAYDRVVVGDDGALWVFRTVEPGGGRGIDVFAPDGTYVGPVELPLDPARLTVHLATSEALYGVVRAPTGEASVVRLRIVRPG